MKKITTVLFDLDGTLIDTNELIINSFLYIFEQYYPGKYQRQDIYPFIGPTLKQSFTALDPERAEEMIAAYRKYNFKHHDEMVADFEGVPETLKTLQNAGYKMGIVTSKIREGAMRGIKLKNMESFFDCIVTSDDVRLPKPDPEGIFQAMTYLQSTPEQTLMIGDNHHDIEAGKNAGVLTSGCAWTLKGRDYLAAYNPDYMLENMQDLLTILGER